MRALICAIATLLLAAPALAETFKRPIPQPQSATAEWWFFAASVSFLIALLAVHLPVRRR